MEAKRDLLDTGLSPFKEVSGSWLTEEHGRIVVNVGIKGATDTDQARLESAAYQHPALNADVRVVDVPYSVSELESYQDGLMSGAVSKGIPISVAIRPDLGRLEVTLQPGTADSVQRDLTNLVPDCVAEVVSGDPIGYSTYTRQDMPAVKAGKVIEMHAYALDPRCTTGFVFELDGPGQQPLRGSTAGHCTQGIVSVFDGLDDNVGATVSPNLLRGTGPPAVADGVLWDPEMPRSDIDNYVIQDTDTIVRVDAGFTRGDVSNGDTICRTGISSGTDCGQIIDTNYDYTLEYIDFATSNTVYKAVDGGLVAAPNATGGDSGGPIWVSLIGPPLRCAALGLTSAKQSDGDVIFTLTSNIAGNTSSHVWTGD